MCVQKFLWRASSISLKLYSLASGREILNFELLSVGCERVSMYVFWDIEDVLHASFWIHRPEPCFNITEGYKILCGKFHPIHIQIILADKKASISEKKFTALLSFFYWCPQPAAEWKKAVCLDGLSLWFYFHLFTNISGRLHKLKR